MVELGWSSKLNAEWEFLTMLRDEGRRAADVFLAEHGDALGHRLLHGPRHLLAGALAVGLVGVLLSLGLLVWLWPTGAGACCWRRSRLQWPPPSPVCRCSRAGRRPSGQRGSIRRAVFPLFLLGALFGKLMEDSGAVERIAASMTWKLGARRAVTHGLGPGSAGRWAAFGSQSTSSVVNSGVFCSAQWTVTGVSGPTRARETGHEQRLRRCS
jgi:GntP family permease